MGKSTTAKSGGFTFVELLVTVTIVSILAFFAVPEYGAWIKAQRLTSASDTLRASLLKARTEAQRTQGQVSLCRTGDIYPSDPDCNALIVGTSNPNQPNQWTHGWLIYETTATSVPYDPLTHQLIQAVASGVADDQVVITSDGSATSYITFGPDGRLDTGSAEIAVCDDRNGGEYGYLISFSASGRPIVENFRDLPVSDRDCTP